MTDAPPPPAAAAAPAAPPGKSRTQRAALAFGTSVGFLVVSMALSFVTTPMLVRMLGSDRFGVNRALLDAFAYIALLEFGLAGASRLVVVNAVGTRDPEVVAHTLRAITKRFLGPLLLKAVAATGLVLLLPHLLKVPPSLQHETTIAAAILVVSVLNTPASVFGHLLAAQQREYNNGIVQGLQNLALTVLAVVAAALGYGLPGQASVAVGTSLLASTVLFFLVWPSFRIKSARPDLEGEAVRKLRKLGWVILLRSLCSRIAVNSDRLFIAGLLSVSVVTRFHVSVRLVDVVTPFLFAIGNSSWPAIADLKLRGSQEHFEARLQEVSTLIVLVGVLMLAPAIIVSAPFVERWMGGHIFLGHVVVCLAALNAIFLALVSFWDFCIGTVGDARTLLPPSLVAAVVNVGVTIVATHAAGPMGPVLGTTLAVGGITLSWNAWLLSTQLGVRAAVLLKSVLRVLVAGVAYVAFGLLVVSPHCQPTWPHIVGWLAVSGAVWAGLGWWLLMSPAMRAQTTARLTHLLGRFKRA